MTNETYETRKAEELKRTLTLREAADQLNKLLADHPECADFPLDAEGCDCYGSAQCFEADAKAKSASLRRIESLKVGSSKEYIFVPALPPTTPKEYMDEGAEAALKQMDEDAVRVLRSAGWSTDSHDVDI